MDFNDYIYELGCETPIYKYISKKDFKEYYLCDSSTLLFQDVRNWKDGGEGLLNEFIEKCRGEKPTTFLGCCWTREKAPDRFYKDEGLAEKANESLASYGSDSMWQIYCPDGGVRIKTTIGKVHDIISKNNLKIHKHAKVGYFSSSVGCNVGSNAFFIKRPGFIHENEYRFILSPCSRTEVSLEFELFDAIDEFLISPALSDQSNEARDIFRFINEKIERDIGFDYSVGRRNNKPEVNISQLYDPVSQEV